MTAPCRCRWCGKPTPKQTKTVYLRREKTQYDVNASYCRYVYTPEPVKSIAECRKLTNQQVVSVQWTRDKSQIATFAEWDGETYADPYFCNGEHAKRFAHVVARDKPDLGMPDFHKGRDADREKQKERTE